MPDLSVAHIRKFVAAIVGATAQAVALGLLDDQAGKYLAVFIAACTALGVYSLPNSDQG